MDDASLDASVVTLVGMSCNHCRTVKKSNVLNHVTIINISQNSSSPTSTGSSVSDVTRRAPPTAGSSAHCGLTRDAGETRPVSTGDFMDVSCGATAGLRLDRWGSLQQTVDGPVLRSWVRV